MALTQAPSDNIDVTPKNELSQKAQERVNIVAQSAITILGESLDDQSAIKNLFDTMVSENLRDPKITIRIQDWLYKANSKRLADAKPSDRLPILQGFTKFMEKFTQWIAQMNRDVGLSDQANTLKDKTDEKMAQVKATYTNILSAHRPTEASNVA